MAELDIAHLRLLNQHLASVPFAKPDEVVSWLGAVQAQDFAGAKWALGQRLNGATDMDVERAFTEGAILRTHLLRPTWHFVTQADIRWMLALTAPRVHAMNAQYYRKFGLDQAVLTRSRDLFVQALRGGNALTREELRGVLEQAGIATRFEQRLAYIVMRAELDGIVCSGPRRGKQFTYMLLDERAPHARIMERDEALAELTRRYFLSHGPATVQDFVWWSGLTAADTRIGLEMVGSQLLEEVIDGKTYWFSPSAPPAREPIPAAFLLPNYDEFGSHKDRSAVLDAWKANNLVFSHIVVIDGRVTGAWKRTFQGRTVVLETDFFGPLTEAEVRAVKAAATRFGAFLELPVVLNGIS